METEGRMRLLFDPQGVLLHEELQGPTAASALEDRAWDDAWTRIERDLREELCAFREGTRSLHELRRLRQYMGMLEAVDAAPREAPRWAGRSRLVAGLAVAASVAVIAGVMVTRQPEVAQAPKEAPRATQEAARPNPPSAATAPAPTTDVGRRPASVRHARSTSETGQVVVLSPIRLVRAAAPTKPAATKGYAVSFGEFANHTGAEGRMRLIRGKGYLVYLMRNGNSFHVMTRPHRTREQAERLASALQEIGLPARAQFAGTAQL
jgi:cell division septation protein DedD